MYTQHFMFHFTPEFKQNQKKNVAKLNRHNRLNRKACIFFMKIISFVRLNSTEIIFSVNEILI